MRSARRDERIGATAHYTAYAWYRLGLPYAHLFVTRAGRRLFSAFRFAGEGVARLSPRVPTMLQYLGQRHRVIDVLLARAAPDRVVELGAGLSRRGVCWAADREVDYVEVDLPPMIAAKRRMLRERASPALSRKLEARLSLVEGDVLAPELPRQLQRELAGAARPVVIAEGVMSYFGAGERRRILQSTREALEATGGGLLLCDLRTEEARRDMPWASTLLRVGASIATRGRGHRRDFRDAAEAQRAFEQAGFAHAAPVEPAEMLADTVRSPNRVWRASV